MEGMAIWGACYFLTLSVYVGSLSLCIAWIMIFPREKQHGRANWVPSRRGFVMSCVSGLCSFFAAADQASICRAGLPGLARSAAFLVADEFEDLDTYWRCDYLFSHLSCVESQRWVF